MAQTSHVSPDVLEILTLLGASPALTVVTIQWSGTSGSAHITIRKTTQSREGLPQDRYAWEAWGSTDRYAWGRGGGRTYDTALAAYQGAVAVMQTALHRQSGEGVLAAD